MFDPVAPFEGFASSTLSPALLRAPLVGVGRGMRVARPVSTSRTPTFAIRAKNPLCAEVRAYGFFHFDRLAEYVRSLPYAHTSTPHDPLAVLREGRGSGIDKHHLLAMVAHASKHDEVRLSIGLYEMTPKNTPGIAAVLKAAGHESIVDARCCLVVGSERLAFTGMQSAETSVSEALQSERQVDPAQLHATYDRLLRETFGRWAQANGRTVGSARALREACIAAWVAQSSPHPAGSVAARA